eukprot:scaffold449_cov184-Amphora_coffeaeformis.AAC.18
MNIDQSLFFPFGPFPRQVRHDGSKARLLGFLDEYLDSFNPYGFISEPTMKLMQPQGDVRMSHNVLGA